MQVRASDRAAGALVLLAIWALGMEVAPAIHLATHHAIGVHAHGGEAHSHGLALERDRDRASDHGTNSLEHRGVAALTPAPVVLRIGSAPVAELLTIAAPIAIDGSHPLSLPPARGPPARA